MQVTGISKEVAATIPNIGEIWLGQGGIYAGVCRGRDGQPDHYLILAAAKPAEQLNWKNALAWAKTVEAEGHVDFAVPDRFQSAVLFGNVGEQFERDWHWTSTQYSATTAWNQYFDGGNQYYDGKSYEGLARAVRRLAINPSVLSTEAADAVTA